MNDATWRFLAGLQSRRCAFEQSLGADWLKRRAKGQTFWLSGRCSVPWMLSRVARLILSVLVPTPQMANRICAAQNCQDANGRQLRQPAVCPTSSHLHAPLNLRNLSESVYELSIELALLMHSVYDLQCHAACAL